MPNNDELREGVEKVLAEMRDDPALVDYLFGPEGDDHDRFVGQQMADPEVRAAYARANYERGWNAARDEFRPRAERAEAAEADLRRDRDHWHQMFLDMRGYRDAYREDFQRDEEALERVRALAADWCAMDPYGEISFNDAADAILAVLDGTADTEGEDR